jgi:hypothetical protein
VWEACNEEDCFDLYEPSDEYDVWLGKSLMLYEKGWKYTLLFWVDVGLSCVWNMTGFLFKAVTINSVEMILKSIIFGLIIFAKERCVHCDWVYMSKIV